MFFFVDSLSSCLLKFDSFSLVDLCLKIGAESRCNQFLGRRNCELTRSILSHLSPAGNTSVTLDVTGESDTF